MQWAKQKQPGFTIVELLIVVVVIAILAAITIVSYNGISIRAENTKTTQAAAQAARSLMNYATQNQSYPSTGGVFSCIGAAPCGNITDTTSPCFVVGQFSGTINTQINTVSSVPTGSTRSSACGGKQYSGIFFRSSDRMLVWMLIGDTSCEAGGLSGIDKLFNGNTTRCFGRVPEL